MNQQSRERVALAVFLLLVVAVIAAGVVYITVGHNWNTAATTIDDAAGSLDGYTAIVYDGVKVPATFDDKVDSSHDITSKVSLAASYEEKHADVIVLHTTDLAFYREGVILKAGDKRVGVFSVASQEDASLYQNVVGTLKSQGVDYTVCIAADTSLLVAAHGTRDIDIVIDLGLGTQETASAVSNGTYLVTAPAVGKIGSVLVSPSNVVSDKSTS